MASRKSNSGLSKSLILKGLQCQKALWLTKNPPDFELPPKPDLQALFRAGTEIGILAQQLFPGGVEVPFEGLSFSEQLARARQLIDSDAKVLYEASFSFSAIFVKVDILVRDGSGWQIHEVKMGTGVKDVNLNDVAVQHYVLNGCGLNVSKSFLVHINNKYVRQGDIEVGQLFVSEDISQQVLARLQGIPEVVTELRSVLRGDTKPAIDIGPHCNDPYECDFIPYCWQHIPVDSIFDLRGRGIDKFELYRQGIVWLADVPPEQLNPAQLFQAEATLEQKDVTNHEAVGEFLDSLWYPLCHLDFETFDTPIPPFDGVRPYQKIPFQYSLHIQQQAGAEPEHFEYLARPNFDPRRELIEQLLAAIPAEACILTYNQAFEKSVLRELAKLFPDLDEAIEVRIANVRDLMLPFKKHDVYRWPMRGSYSIKQVLPAMVPELSYAGLEIADGMAAMQAYRDMCALDDPVALAELRQAMLEYCRLDTLAMVRILGELAETGECP